jgi:CheY-like chemotaxis protein
MAVAPGRNVSRNQTSTTRDRAERGTRLYELSCGALRPRVLVAEDDDAFRRLLAATLRRDGFDVVEARTGREVVELVASFVQRCGELFDLIISDIRMPQMTGLDALAGLRGAGWPISVILITAFSDDETRLEAKRLGAKALFSKPFDLADLRTTALYLAGA